MYLIAHVFVYLLGHTVGVYQLGGDLKSGKNDANADYYAKIMVKG